jgi:hypothetical protein
LSDFVITTYEANKMAAPASILTQVETYQMSGLALLVNQNPFIAESNKKFKDFAKFEGQLGDTVNFDLPPRMRGQNSLAVTFTGVTQRLQPLTVNNEYAVPYSFSAQDFIFNVDEYMDKFGNSAIAEIGAEVGSSVAQNGIDHTYRAYNAPELGVGTIDPINSIQQYAQAVANFRNYGSPNSKAKAFVDDVSIPSVVNNNLSQFVMRRNEDEANSWYLGETSNCEFFSSNLLPIHVAGTVGDDAEILTVDSIDGTGTVITLSGATPNTATLVAGDILTFKTPTPNANVLKLVTFTGHKPCAQDVQARVTVGDTADGTGELTVTVYPALISDGTSPEQYVNNTVVGNSVGCAPTHRAGFLCADNPLFLAMPMLPDETPYATANQIDPDTGCSVRYYYGSKFGQNERGFVNDTIWGSTMADDYAMRLIYPV